MPENYRLAGGTGWCIRMQRPDWPGRVTWRTSLRFRSIFRVLNLFDSGDLSFARTLSHQTQRVENRVWREFTCPTRVCIFRRQAFGPNSEWLWQNGRKGTDALGRPAPARARNDGRHGTSFMEQTRNVNSAPLFWCSAFTVHSPVPPITQIRNLTYFFISLFISIHCRHETRNYTSYVCCQHNVMLYKI